ncbi:MAG: hypothetical protein JWQ27_1058 [Ferruginibacter sp.]|nr:hypothetical protein [Ferruginibacter sp.]
MKTFKIIDAWISILLISTFSLLSLIKLDATFLIGYCIVGTWQVISLCIHSVQGWFRFNPDRHAYKCMVAILLVIGLIGLVWPALLMIEMFLLLFISPMLAVYYSWICYNETYVKMQRPLAVLK